jgi:hypothetical protein
MVFTHEERQLLRALYELNTDTSTCLVNLLSEEMVVYETICVNGKLLPFKDGVYKFHFSPKMQFVQIMDFMLYDFAELNRNGFIPLTKCLETIILHGSTGSNLYKIVKSYRQHEQQQEECEIYFPRIFTPIFCLGLYKA